ncbi:MAG: phosphomannomutase [Gammaproteobacteria bacterium]|nr:phosphomannomutase [Gammaproteobacteria bacterium]
MQQDDTGVNPKAAFKAYDIRGRVPDELNVDMARAIGAGFAALFNTKQVVIGRDARPSGAALSAALAEGLRAQGVNVLDLGLCGTEEIYFATAHLGVDGGVMITASHNPPEYNGMKFVTAGARPVSFDTGLETLADWVAVNPAAGRGTPRGGYRMVDTRPDYVRHLRNYVGKDAIHPLRVVVNAGNGMAGPAFDALAAGLPLEVVRLAHAVDSTFPNGVPNPMLAKNRAATASAVRTEHAALGIAWDGDFDRCFIFDEAGAFIESYYLIGLFAEYFLHRFPGAKIIHDPRLVWNTLDIVTRVSGVAMESRCGHAYIKARMREEDAVYGGEMSGHHYFRDFFYCDSGMLPWLLLLARLTTERAPLSELVAERQRRFPVSGEINRTVDNADQVLQRVTEHFRPQAASITNVDGVSLAFADWRFNLRKSNTEPLVRLNVETRGDTALLKARTAELLELIGGQPG